MWLVILRYIYCGKISVEEYDIPDLLKILVTASELNLQELSNYLQSFLVKNNASWIEQSFNLVYQTTFENDSFLELQKYCNDIISKKPHKLFRSLNFSLIPEKVLISIIQNDDLQMREIQVWEHVLKWGIAQNPELPTDPINFSKNDFNILKNTLQQCIPSIRFYNLTSKEFSDKVLPYKKILPKELYMDLLKSFLNLNPKSRISRKSKPRNYDIDPEIIDLQHVELISRWIDKLDIKEDSTSYEFKLILRGSRDGFSIDKFHEICNNKPHTVTIAKVKDSDEILGGYNPVEWKSVDGYASTKDSFIFSFKSSSSTENYVLSRVVNENCAIWNGKNYGPYFGNGDFVLYIINNSYCSKNHYDKPIRETGSAFSVEEYEVFQITKINI
ncbi:carbohydrate-binding module family 13 protein [Rhizophagus clarus]|uniref:Carbohydrate-binding module family 13 protein n=1 Tax=Rhizophagus clarus TaxID=94130 RepID=A0A8H3QXT5_9GLOM|nr:carbohydrate-binding module family 13 protein [Rhizophagus clarus]